MIYPFTLKHSIAQRTRIRWAGDAEGRATVEELADRIEELAGINRALARPATGSIIIEHDSIDGQTLLQILGEELAIEIKSQAEPSPTGLERFNQNLDLLDRQMRKANFDLGSMTFLLLLAMAAAQAMRGQIGVSSVSFLWYALTVAAKSRRPATRAAADDGNTISWP